LVTLKICILGQHQSQELALSRHIKSIDCDAEKHPGMARMRVTLDDFRIQGPHGAHQCLVFPPLGGTLAYLRNLFQDGALEKTLLQKCMAMVILGLDVLHQAGVVHTGTVNLYENRRSPD
jgi:hypothetical protein